MVTEYPFAHRENGAMLLSVKDLKQEQKRIYFRLPDGEVAAFESACAYYGSYQNVLEKFARHFIAMDQAGRDALMRKMSASQAEHPPAVARSPGVVKGTRPVPIQSPEKPAKR